MSVLFLQVKLLEYSVQRSANRSNRRCRHVSRPGVKLDRDDFIDLAAVSKIIPEKTTAQVIFCGACLLLRYISPVNVIAEGN